MVRAYKYLFYKIYKWSSGLEYDKTPEYTALFSVSGLLLLDLMALSNIIEGLFEIPNFLFINKFYGIIFTIGIAFLHYLIFLNKIGINQIIKEFDGETNEESFRRGIYVGIYILISMASFPISFAFLR